MKIIFTKLAYEKLKAYIMSIDYEISGFGKVEKRDGDLYIVDIRIFPQVVSSGHTEMDAISLAGFWDELMQQGEDIGTWKLWWHSHVYMQAMFSGTDLDTIADFDAEVSEENWILSIVANKLGELLCRVDVFQPIRCIINNIDYEVEEGLGIQIDVSQEIQAKVKLYSHEEEGKIYWPIVHGSEAWPILPPVIKDGKPLSYLERLQLFREQGILDSGITKESAEIIDVPFEGNG